MKKRLKYAMVGGAKTSFIGPIHRMAIRMDDLADLVAGNFSRDARTNAANGAAFRLDPARVYPDWQRLIAAEKGRIDFLVICTTNETHYAIAKAALEAAVQEAVGRHCPGLGGQAARIEELEKRVAELEAKLAGR